MRGPLLAANELLNPVSCNKVKRVVRFPFCATTVRRVCDCENPTKEARNATITRNFIVGKVG